ncbi:MAG TPA: response regulator transcription factor [Rhodocyclaceae bacterium]
MIKIVIAEDNVSYAEDVVEYLTDIGYTVRAAASAAELWQTLAAEAADVLLLDLGLPDQDGFHLIPQLRQLYPAMGLIVLTARVTFDNRVQGLRLGADTYLTKPIKFPELAAHIEALCRRIAPQPDEAAASPWRLRTTERQIECAGKGVLSLTEKEFGFLHLLAQNRLPVPRASLLIGIGERDDLAAAKRLDMLVYRLRKKIRSAWEIELPLRSSYGGGFALLAAIALS